MRIEEMFNLWRLATVIKFNHFGEVLCEFHTSFYQSEVTVSGCSPT